jgi:hypothetical protein
MTTLTDNPIYCLALVKPGSPLARKWNVLKPSYGIYEHAPAFERRLLHWGDGTWQEITDRNHTDLILLPPFTEKDIQEIFDRAR